MINIPKPNTSIVDKHYQSIKSFFRRGTKFNFTSLDSWYLNNSNDKYSFKTVIKANPEDFPDIIDAFSGANSNAPEMKYLIYIYSCYSKVNDTFFGQASKFNALELVKTLGLIVCPFCNRNFITTTSVSNSKGNKIIRRSADLDHFYDKVKYPYLAISFYNLIPCCKACNHLKGTNELTINPYLIKSLEDNFTFDYGFDKSINEFKIETLNMTPNYKVNWDTLGLEEHYQNHNGYLEEILTRIQIYNKDYLENLLEKFFEHEGDSLEIIKNTFIDIENLKKLIIGNLHSQDKMNNAPLSKLTKDIVDKYYW